MRRWATWGGWVLLWLGCNANDSTRSLSPDPDPAPLEHRFEAPDGGALHPARDAGAPVTDAGAVDAGQPPDAGVADAGAPVRPDAGLWVPDAGSITGTPGPWPTDAVKNYSVDYGIGPVQSVGIDEAHNLWLLDGARIGVLRPGTSQPVWTSHVGQASQPFGAGALAGGSTVICGGSPGRAYVGYWTYDLPVPYRQDPSDPEYLKGDLDAVRLHVDGSVSLEAHLGETTDSSGYKHLGLRNTNDFHYDEDRSVLVCQRVMRGPHAGELYIGTNHGVTRIQGLVYNSHRHPVWDVNGSLRIGYSYGLGIARNGDVLIANEWKIGIVPPPAALRDWDNHSVAPYRINTYVHSLNALEEMDYWRGFEQTVDGTYYLGSQRYGLWSFQLPASGSPQSYSKVAGLPTDRISALAATEDGSLFVGTEDQGLLRLDPQKQLAPVAVSGARVRQLVYDPSVSPSILLVLTEAGLTVLRGP